ncbi:RHS repeat-associated core domain-containing protein [Prosthecobacter debontii]|uniref:RHS repeat-associated core domain-containing protein n=2 Tax=Prosthecobacter debontii TaxID=48467 RepID=A0A1T4YUN4_9BACT|nr:RHS repeat-associated core domain-containing protein [Prosthecobacter debontii]
MAFHGGGANPQVTTTASDLVALLGADAAAQELVEVTGAGSTPLQPLPRTALTGVKDKPPITSTLSEVVAAIQAHPQASALLTATASSGSTGRTSYQWTSQDRLAGVTMPDGTQHDYSYDYRARRVGMARHGGPEPARDTAVVFSGGLSVAEYEGVPGFAVSPEAPSVHYVRGPDMGGGVGGMLYSVRGSTVKYSLSNGRGDIIAQSDASATITWTASYEAYGKRPVETGENLDKQRANSKDEDPTGLLNEGFRYRDIETGMWLSRDPAGFVDGPNLYAYVKQNPWTGFDPHGLEFYGTNEGNETPEVRQAIRDADNAVYSHIGGMLKGTGNVIHGILKQVKSAIFGEKDAFDIFPGVTLVEHEINGTKPKLPDITTAEGQGEAITGAALLFEGAKTTSGGGKTPTSSGQKTAATNAAIVEAETGPLKGSGGPGKVYEIPANQLIANKPYIGKTRQPTVADRMKAKDHRSKTPTGHPPQAKTLAEDLTDNETAGVEALLIEQRGLQNLSNKIPGLNTSLPKNKERIEAGKKVLEQAK